MVTLLLVSRVIVNTGETQYRGVEQLVARRAHNPKVRGSSPLPATNVIYSNAVYIRNKCRIYTLV